jgi:ABC-type nickel/cobalt efflux system permease component RcnA
MLGIDDAIAGLDGGGGLAVALVVALLLGLRHATDPDHLTAVTTLMMSDDRRGPRRAASLGLAWGAGHAATLFAVGLPIVLFDSYLPSWLQQALELAVGVVIVALAVRLLMRWQRGYFHAHAHSHGALRHAHPHVHEGDARDPHPRAHEHPHGTQLGRSPAAAFGIGLVHGAGGSAGIGVLLVAAVPGAGQAIAALAMLAIGTALSMATVSAGLGYALARGPLARRAELAAPALGTLNLAFGVWYALAALHALPYLF